MKKEILFLWFGDVYPSYTEWVLYNFKLINPGWDIIFIQYTLNQVKNYLSQNDQVLINTIDEYNLGKKTKVAVSLADIYRRKYLELNITKQIPTVYCDLDCFPISPIDNFVLTDYDKAIKCKQWFKQFNSKSIAIGYNTFNDNGKWIRRSDIWFHTNVPLTNIILMMSKKFNYASSYTYINNQMLINLDQTDEYEYRKKQFLSGQLKLNDVFCNPILTPIEHYSLRSYINNTQKIEF